MYDFEDVNALLTDCADEGMIEPIDDPAIEIDFYDWADVIGILDQVEPNIHWA